MDASCCWIALTQPSMAHSEAGGGVHPITVIRKHDDIFAMRMLLEVEGKRPEQFREFAKVEAALKELDAASPHSFASLTRQDGSYVQVAGGKHLCIVERRNTGENTHWRACHAEPPSPSDAPHVLKFGGGQMTMAEEEVFSIDEVIFVWRAFFESKPFPKGTMWRDMTGMFQSS